MHLKCRTHSLDYMLRDHDVGRFIFDTVAPVNSITDALPGISELRLQLLHKQAGLNRHQRYTRWRVFSYTSVHVLYKQAVG